MLFSIKQSHRENSNDNKLNLLSKFKKCNFKRMKRRRKTITFHSYFLDFFVFQISFFFPLQQWSHGNCQNIILYENQPLSLLNLDALQCKSIIPTHFFPSSGGKPFARAKLLNGILPHMQYFCLAGILNSFMMEAVIIQKPVH